jgi:hypothetical protein
MTEADIQQAVRLRCAALGWHMWRNNVGVLVDTSGRPLRYGLANDSKAVNSVLKSGDLIGWDNTGRFVSIECKAPNGRAHPAQIAWRDLVLAGGGRAMIIRDPKEVV